MQMVLESLKTVYERNAFGVCASMGEKWQVPTSRIRLLFIYASFITAGSPVFVYFVLLGLMEFKKNLQRPHSSIWDF